LADPTYTPPEVWTFDAENGGRFASINRPTAGAREAKELPVGEHDFQLYSLATPNGVKATVMFEELLEAGHSGAEYDAWTVNIGDGTQFTSGFVDVNPNSKIPALLDRSGDTPVRIFESGAILMHLAEKFGAFLPTDHTRAEVLSWLFWQVGSAISTLMRRRNTNTPSTAMRWKLRGCLTLRISASRRTSIWAARITRSPTWQPSHGLLHL